MMSDSVEGGAYRIDSRWDLRRQLYGSSCCLEEGLVRSSSKLQATEEGRQVGDEG